MSERVGFVFCALLFATWTVSNAEEAAGSPNASAASDFVETTISSPHEAESMAENYVTPPPETTTPMSPEETTPYEDDPQHLERQHMEDFMKIEERIYVIKRNFNLKHPEKCESAQRLAKIDDQNCLYTLRVRHQMNKNIMLPHNVPFTISKTGIHKEYNAVTYQHGFDEPRVERKLMYISPEKTCAILVENLSNGGKGCQLVQPDSAIDAGIPQECNRIYRANCGKRSVQIYESSCRGIPDKVAREEL